MKIKHIFILLAYVVGICSVYLIGDPDYIEYSDKIQGVSFLLCAIFLAFYLALSSWSKEAFIFIPAFAMSAWGGLQLAVMVVWISIGGFAP